MTTQQIELFLSAVKKQSFSKVAEEFYISQPTVGRQITLLEEELGFPLFYRDKKYLRLTPSGAVMLAEFTKQQISLRTAISQADQVRSGFEGKLSIGYLTGLNTDYYVYPSTITFSDSYPKIAVNMENASFRPLRQRLNSGEYDLIFTYSFELPTMQDIAFQHVCSADVSLIISAQHPLAKKESITASDLHGETLIIPSPMDCDGRMAESFETLSRTFGCTEEDFDKISLRVTDTLETKQFLLRSGIGFGFTSSCMDYAYDTRYVLFPLQDGVTELYAVWKKDNPNPTLPLYIQSMSNP